MTHFWSEIVRRLRRLFRQVEFQVSRRFALATREDRIFFALVPTVGLVAGGLALFVAALKAADSLFRIDPAAQCSLAKVDLASAALKLGQAARLGFPRLPGGALHSTFLLRCQLGSGG